jgi:hypothetical protein
MSPKGSCVKDLVTNLWYYWEVVEPLEGIVGGHWVSGSVGASLEWDIETLVDAYLSLSLSFSLDYTL